LPLKIKLQRKGSKNRPFYRVVIQNSTEKLNGAVVDVLGQYDPLKDPSVFTVDSEKTKDWIKKGATPTPRLKILLGKAGITEPVNLDKLVKRKPRAEQKAEAAAEGEKPAEAKADKPAEAKAEEKPKEKAKEKPKEEPKAESKEAPKKEAPKEVKKEEPKPEAQAKETQK